MQNLVSRQLTPAENEVIELIRMESPDVLAGQFHDLFTLLISDFPDHTEFVPYRNSLANLQSLVNCLHPLPTAIEVEK